MRHGSGWWPLSGALAAARSSLPTRRSRQVGRSAKKGVRHTTLASASASGTGRHGSAPAAIPSGQKHRGLSQTLTVRAAGRSRPWSRVHRAGSQTRLGVRRTTKGCRQVVTSLHCATSAHAGSDSCRPVRFCPRAHGALAPEDRAARCVGAEIPIQQNARNSGSVRGTVVHAGAMFSDGCRSR